jgi:hypothetical protein
MAHTNNKNMATASLLTEILAYLTACTPARGRHQLYFLLNERETPSQQNLDRCNRRQNSRWMRWRALKIYLITTEGGLTKVQFRNRLTIGRNRDASLGPTPSVCVWGGARGGELRGGRGWPAQCCLIPPPGGH